jgi:hypothetical protein
LTTENWQKNPYGKSGIEIQAAHLQEQWNDMTA